MKLPDVKVETVFTPFNGGFDNVTPPLQLAPGYCRQTQNYECDINGGYIGTSGYERVDGQASPSDAIYAVLNVVLSGTVNVGDVLTDNLAAASGTVIALTSTQAILTMMNGIFATGNVRVSGTIVGTCIGPQIIDGASTAQLQAQYKNLAADAYRALIAPIPGSGPVLGVHLYKDVLYGFRNNTGGTATNMYKSSPTGWQQVALGNELSFTSGGTYQVNEGDTITGATSGATAVVSRIVLESGTWAAGTAAGRFFFATQTGTFGTENLNVGINMNVASITGNSSAIIFANPGGRFEFIDENFGGGADTIKMYGCDGKNNAFEFDGTTLVQIHTGMVIDEPSHIYSHKNQLFLSFLGSVQNSSIGAPYQWTPITGAGEIAMGDIVTGFMVQAGSDGTPALTIFTRNKISTLYGSSTADWQLVPYKREAGALAYSVQSITNTVMFDDRGITTLQASQVYGNFVDATISRRIQNWLTDKRTKVTDSCIARDKNQYRLYFSDNSSIYVTFDNKKVVGMMPQLFAHTVLCVSSTERLDGSEAIYFGSDDGYVFQMESGTSFDGDSIERFMYLSYDNSKSPRLNKRYRGATFEVSGDGYAEFDFSYQLGYSSIYIGQPGSTNMATNFSSAVWDAFVWDAFVWDGQTLSPSECDMGGTSENVSLIIHSNSDYFVPIKFSGALIDLSPRRRLRT